MKKLLTIIIVLVTIQLSAQDTTSAAKEEPKDTTWMADGSFGTALTRVNLQNWTGGGQSSLSLSTIFKGHLKYEKKNVLWDNSLDVGYGQARVGGSESRFKKSDDQLIFVSKVYRKISKRWNFSGMLDFRSQLANGFSYSEDSTAKFGEKATLISRFLAPGYLLATAGFTYRYDDVFYATIAPMSGSKFTFVTHEGLSNAGAYGVDSGKKVRMEIGSMIKLGVKKEIMENVSIKSNLTLFSGLSTFGNIDVNWETILQFKINDYLTTTFTTLLIYDDDIDVEIDSNEDGEVDKKGPRIQYKDVLNIGFLYKF